MILVFSPLCSHCQRARPEWDAAATWLQRNDPRVQTLRVDAAHLAAQTTTTRPDGVDDVLDRVRAHPEFTGVPFVAIASCDGRIVAFRGAVTADGLVAFAQQRADSHTHHVGTPHGE